MMVGLAGQVFPLGCRNDAPQLGLWSIVTVMGSASGRRLGRRR